MHYQPIVSIDTSAVVGAEALIRWQHPERGLVPPMEFIPLAEKTGLIVGIGHWVLEEACREAAGWDVDGSSGVAPYVSVNVSSAQLQQPGFVLEVEDVLETSGLEPARLVLEVTESALIEDSEGNVLKLAQLRDIGIRLAIDDFGTGYSSLSYLRQFNLDILKIDKSFIDVLGRDSKGSALVAAMVAMGTSLGMEVIAEGIEDHGQLQDLRTLHCDLGQGYLFAKPVTADRFPARYRWRCAQRSTRFADRRSSRRERGPHGYAAQVELAATEATRSSSQPGVEAPGVGSPADRRRGGVSLRDRRGRGVVAGHSRHPVHARLWHGLSSPGPARRYPGPARGGVQEPPRRADRLSVPSSRPRGTA